MLEKLLDIIGEDALTRLCIVFGGVKIYVCDSESLRKKLEIIVGAAAAQKIIEAYPGESIEIPNLKHLAFEKRKRGIFADRESMSVRELAMKYDLTERQIRNILNNNYDSKEQSCDTMKTKTDQRLQTTTQENSPQPSYPAWMTGSGGKVK